MINEKYSIGISSMDEQHATLLDLMDDFYKNLRSRANDENIGIMITKMKEYAILHFEAEEKILKELNYPKYEEQKESHKWYIDQIADMEKRFNNGKLKLSFEVTSFIKDWFVNHILGEDKEYSEFLRTHGVN